MKKCKMLIMNQNVFPIMLASKLWLNKCMFVLGFREVTLANKLYIPSELATQMYCNHIGIDQNCRLEQSGIWLKQICAGDFHLFSFNKILLILCPSPSGLK